MGSTGVVKSSATGDRHSTHVGPTFADDLTFLQKYTAVVVLSDPTGRAQVAVVPAYQGRVMTSTSGGLQGVSYGWVNKELIASGKTQPHINVFGGEDRFWIGPEGGQFSIFFAAGVPFDLEHWFTPAAIDTEPFDLVEADAAHAVFHRMFHLTNYSRMRFDIEVRREIRLLDQQTLWKRLAIKDPGQVSAVAFESLNSLRNSGPREWEKSTGLLSIWILGMFNASPSTVIAVPFAKGSEHELGPTVNDAYFGKVPADRLRIGDGLLFFRADSNYRSKIGLSAARSKTLVASYDAANHVLTLVLYSKAAGAKDYVNSMWEIQQQPYSGDVVNSYNDGPPSPGAKQLGHFYELETSSPALSLAPRQAATHTHTTFHLQGPEAALNKVAQPLLGVTVDQIRDSLEH